MADRPMTRSERIAAQRAAFTAWARTADTDEVPGDLTPPAG